MLLIRYWNIYSAKKHWLQHSAFWENEIYHDKFK